MQFTPRIDFLKETLKTVKDPMVDSVIRYKDDDRGVTIDLHKLSKEFIDRLYDVVEAWPAKDKKDEDAKYRCNYKIRSYRKLMENPGKVLPKKLESLCEQMIEFVKKTEHKYVFVETSDDQLLPMYVREIKYVPTSRYDPAHVEISCLASVRGRKISHSFSFYRSSLGLMADKIMANTGIYLETEELFKDYVSSLERLSHYRKLDLNQVSAFGLANTVSYFNNPGSYNDFICSRGERRNIRAMFRDGRATKFVLDDELDRGDREDLTSPILFWKNRRASVRATTEIETDDDFEDSDDVEGADIQETPKSMVSKDFVSSPEWPYMRGFDLGNHEFVHIHVNNIESYEWKVVDDKLVLPDSHKELTKILMTSAEQLMEDIVSGKTGGIIIVATGDPGLGKTLTAEIYSELIQRPLYNVQCSQLGINVDDIEKNLKMVLERAQRWQAIILIDEADVYIRRRGNDIVQNAIVGVFLRLIEYYRGVLFMTSNRSTEIDDAILSRATAHIRYELPGVRLPKIWAVLADQFKVELKPEDVASICKKHPNLTGRDVKNILKLAKIIGGSLPTIEQLETAISFQDVNEERR